MTDTLKPALQAHLDARALTPRELDEDLALVLARRPRRRPLFVSVGVPSALAVAAFALFVVARGAAPVDAPQVIAPLVDDDNAVHIYIADADDPDSAIVIDFIFNGATP